MWLNTGREEGGRDRLVSGQGKGQIVQACGGHSRKSGLSIGQKWRAAFEGYQAVAKMTRSTLDNDYLLHGCGVQ